MPGAGGAWGGLALSLQTGSFDGSLWLEWGHVSSAVGAPGSARETRGPQGRTEACDSLHVGVRILCVFTFNSRTRQWTILKCASWWHVVHAQGCATSTSLQFETFASLHKNTRCPFSGHSPLCLPQPLAASLLLSDPAICPFWMLHVKGLTRVSPFLSGFLHLA